MDAIHPVLACAAELEASLKSVTDVDPMFMTTTDQRDALLALTRVDAQLAALRLRLTAASGDVAEVEAHRDVAAWLAHHTRVDGGAARRHHRLALSLEHWHVLAAGLAEGAVNPAQAEVIAKALDDLPTDLDPEVLARAESHLVEQAGDYGPRELRILGRRVLEVVAPEIGEDHELRLLQAEEALAHKLTRLITRRRGDGTTDIHARVPDAVADRLTTYLHAYTNPRHHDGEKTPYDVRLGHAFCALLEHTDPHRLPVHGGDATTVLVTIDLQTLRDGVGAALTHTGTPIAPDHARRLACTAGIIPAILGTDGHVLDLGRTARLFSPAQRKALRVRDTTCRAHGCDIPAAWCEAHHAGDPWAHGGTTDLADGQLLCSFHHHKAHDPSYARSRLPNGDVRFHRRR
ncbi:HNH endonuclease signature motif containing protein [Nocardioides sp. InS609-2]|uniref:HNH endonuclease signature motif containing protein n=1 Tax=Nocardioides sp. InS609-2 TaxID=2760705 RepID=UPI0020BD544B|nr:HNH endonuclease signature motif containing protein [Nocardioides sp. InS609-2]